jgi:hypothetical protein
MRLFPSRLFPADIIQPPSVPLHTHTPASTPFRSHSMPDKQTIVAFDLYGTLLSTSSIAGQLERHFGPRAQSIASTWRRYQLEYTWRLNSMGSYIQQQPIGQRSLDRPI